MVKGIQQDRSPHRRQEGEVNFAKNIVLSESLDEASNELGNNLISTVTGTIIGVVPLGQYSIIFTTTPSIYLQKPDLTVTQITDVGGIIASLNLNVDYPVVGKSEFNNDNEIIVAFTDDFNTPKVINIGTPTSNIVTNADDPNDIEMFPSSNIANITTGISKEGLLRSGTYYITYSYATIDTETSEYNVSNPIYIVSGDFAAPGLSGEQYEGDAGNQITDKAITATFTNLDTRYDFIKVGVLFNGGTGLLAYKSDLISYNSSTKSILITSLNNYNNTTVEDLLVPEIRYNKVKSLALLNDRLYGANLEQKDTLDYQQFANNISIGWTIVDYRSINFPSNTSSAEEMNALQEFNGFMAGEVYSFYIRFWYNDGTYSRAFHIPGRTPTASDTTVLTQAQSGGWSNKKRFQVQDTVTGVTGGDMGYWENSNEQYPPGFPSLAGNNVRHHRFPSQRYLYDNLRPTNSDIYKIELPILGINVTNVTNIPSDVRYWEILYSKRDSSNSTVYGMGLGNMVATPGTSGGYDVSELWTTGGNWNIDYNGTPTPALSGNEDRFIVDEAISGANNHEYLRFNSFDTRYGLPGLIEPYIEGVCKYETTATVEEGSTGTVDRKTVEYSPVQSLLNSSSAITDSQKNRRIDNYQYMSTNSNLDVGLVTFRNESSESTLYLQVYNDGVYTEDFEFQDTMVYPSVGTNDATNASINVPNHLCVLKSAREDCYSTYDSQTLVSTGYYNSGSSGTDILGGDCYQGQYNYITYSKNYPSQTTQDSGSLGGLRNVISHCAESNYNLQLRYELGGDLGSRYFPKQSLDTLFGDYDSQIYTYYDWTVEPNNIGYNTFWNLLNDLKQSFIYNPISDFNEVSLPYKVIRSLEQIPESPLINWKKWLSADSYEQTARNRGEIINIQEYFPNLLIHQERGLFITKDRTELPTSAGKVELGAGDIFAIPPTEIITTQNGYAGTQDQLGCLLSKGIYVFPDSQQGKWFMYAGSNNLKEISGNGLRNYMKKYLPHYETDISVATVNVTATYNSVLGITTIPKRSISYIDGIRCVVNYIPPVGWVSDYDNEYYYISGDSSGTTSVTSVTRCNKRIVNNIDLDNPFTSNGYSVAYDEYNNRIILAKTYDSVNHTYIDDDIKIRGVYRLADTSFINSLIVGDIVLDESDNAIKEVTSVSPIVLTEYNSGGFICSYYPDRDMIVSFHDYNGKYFYDNYNIESNLFAIEDSKIYLHNRGKYNTFGDITYDSIIDYVFYNPEKLQWREIFWNTQVIDENGIPQYDDTFKTMRVWCEKFTTPTVQLNPRLTIKLDYTLTLRRTMDEWHCNIIREDTKNTLWNKDFNRPPIDDFRLDEGVLGDKKFYKRQRFNTDWIVVRLTYKDADKQIIVHNVKPNVKPTQR